MQLLVCRKRDAGPAELFRTGLDISHAVARDLRLRRGRALHKKCKSCRVPLESELLLNDRRALRVHHEAALISTIAIGFVLAFGFGYVADRLRLIKLAPSLGGVESLVTQPCTTTHHGIAPEERARRGIPDSMLRLSIGIEDADDLIADLVQALGD